MIKCASDKVFINSQTDFPNSAVNPLMSNQGAPDAANQTKEMEIQVGNSLDLIGHIFPDAKVAATKI